MKKPKPLPRPPQVLTVSEAMDLVNRKRSSLLSQKEARYTVADGVAVFRMRWDALFREHFSTYPPMPVSPTKHVPRIKRQVVVPLKSASITVSEFLDFLFREWSVLPRTRRFSKFKYYPQVPSVDWVLKYADIYIAAFVEGKDGVVEIAKPDPVETKQDNRGMLAKVISAARRDRQLLDREIARLKEENKRLQKLNLRRITSDTAKPTNKPLPEWD